MASPNKVSIRFLDYFFVFLCLLITFPPVFFSEPDCNLDQSWRLAINIALKNNLIFGKDFVFTYGPLGFLSTRETYGLTAFHYLIFDLFNFVVFGRLLLLILGQFTHWLKYLLILISLLSMTLWNSYVSEDMPVFYFVVIFYEFLYYLKTQNKFSPYIIAITGIIGTYIKVNFGLIYIGVILAVVVSLYIAKVLNLKQMLIWGVGYLVALVSVAYLLNTDFFGYFYYSLFVIDGYNDAMYAIPDFNVSMWYLGYFICFLLTGVFVLIHFGLKIRTFTKNDVVESVIAIMVVGVIFVLFKQTVVNGHIFEFPKFITPLAGVMLLIIKREKLFNIYLCVTGSFAIMSALYATTKHVEIFESRIFLQSLNPIESFKKAGSLLTYFKEFKKHKNFKHSTACVYFPADIAAMTAGKTADIIPWEISAVQTNNLVYNPRPLIQSYSVYHHILDEINAAKYQSDSRPEYVFFQLHSLGERDLLHEEVKTKLALMTHYELLNKRVPDFFGSYLIFKRKESPEKIVFSEKREVEIKLNEDFTLPDTDSLMLMDLEWPLSIWGKLKRTLYMPPPIKIEATLEDGQKRVFRLVNPVTKAGVIMNRYIDYMQNSAETEAFFRYTGKYNKKVKSFKVICDEEWGVGKSTKALIYTAAKEKPVEIAPYQEFKNFRFTVPVNGQLEYLDSTRNYLDLKGYAVINVPNSTGGCCSDISLYAKNGEKFYKIEGHLNTRYDVMQKLNLPYQFLNTGFSCIVLKPLLPLGKNEIYLGVENNDGFFSSAPTG